MKRSGRIKRNNAPKPIKLRDRETTQQTVQTPVKKRPLVRPSLPPLKMRPPRRPAEPSLSSDSFKSAMFSAIKEADEHKNAEIGRLRRWAKGLRESWFVVGLEAAGLIGLVFAVGLFIYELRERQSQRVAQSWETVANASPGRSGKKEALEFLNAEYFCVEEPDLVYEIRKSLVSFITIPNIPIEERPFDYGDPIEETVARYYGNRKANWRWCWKERIDLSSLQLGIHTNGGAVDLRGINLEGANLSNGDFSGALLSDANLNGASFFLSNFSGAKLHDVDIENAFFFGADLSNTHINGTLTDVRIYASNLDSAIIGDNSEISNLTIRNSSVNNTHLSIILAKTQTSTGIDTLYFMQPEEICSSLDVLAWAFEDQPPEIEYCLKDSIWFYETHTKEASLNFDGRTPDEVQQFWFSLHGSIDPLIMTPDHNGPGVPTRSDALITNAEVIEEIWANTEQNTQDQMLGTDIHFEND